MSAAALILRILVATVTVIVLGVVGVFGFMVIEPFHAAFGDPPASLGWDSPGGTVLAFTAAGFLGLALVLVIWLVVAPIRRDQRQEFR